VHFVGHGRSACADYVSGLSAQLWMGRVGASVSGVCDVLAAGGVGEVISPVDGSSRSRRLTSSDQ